MARRKRNHRSRESNDFQRWNLPNDLLGSWEPTNEKRETKKPTRGVEPMSVAFEKVRERQRQQSVRRINGL